MLVKIQTSYETGESGPMRRRKSGRLLYVPYKNNVHVKKRREKFYANRLDAECRELKCKEMVEIMFRMFYLLIKYQYLPM